MFRRPFQAPGLAVMHEDRLELIPVVGSPITVILADIVALKEVKWFNGTRLWLKIGYVMDLANGQRVGVAVAEVFARRWRSRLSRGTLPEIAPEASRPTSNGLSQFFAGRSWYVGIIVGLALVGGLIIWGIWERRSLGNAPQTSDRRSQFGALPEADRARAVALFNDIEDFGHEFDAAFTSKNLPAAETGTRRLLTLLTNFNAAVKGTAYEFPPGIFDDIAKVREALREGDWDKVRQAARHNDVYGREFKRISARMVELARQQQPALGNSYGPVVEKVIAGKGDENKRFIDLDTGKQFAAAEFFGPKAEPSPEETRQWWKNNGIDAMGDTSSTSRGLVGFDMVAVPVAEAEWTVAAPERLQYWLTVTRPGTPATMSAAGKLPTTYVFQTREGGRGLLQIAGFTDNLGGVKIRYKLVGTNAPANPRPPG